jgi:hypothetical protein
MGQVSMTPDQKKATDLYTIASRNLDEFKTKLADDTLTLGTLQTLQAIVAANLAAADLNKTVAPIIDAELKRRTPSDTTKASS